MKTIKWYPILIVAVALLLVSGITTAFRTQAFASDADSATAAQPGYDQPASAHSAVASVTTTPAVTGCWSVVPSPNPVNGGGLGGVATISSSDVWAVGFSGVPNHNSSTLTEHWNGNSWSIVPSPSVGPNSTLSRVAAISSSDVWAVGSSSDANGNYPSTLTEHWNGAIWSVVPSPSPGNFQNNLSGVAAISSADVWSVGHYQSISPNANYELVEHWDGSSWSVVPTPNPTDGNSLRGVTAIASNDVWAVGDTITTTLIEHWNGSSWSVVANPSSGNELDGVAATSSSDVWAVGVGGGPTGVTEHWNGSSWTAVPNSGTQYLYGVAAIASTDVWAVGFNYGPPWSTQTIHWNGASWSVVPSPNPGSVQNVLYGVAATTSTDIWAVGLYNNTNYDSNYDTLIEHYSAAGCGTPCPVPFVDIAGNVFYNAIAYLYCRGDLSGTDPTHYSPALTTTRAQFAKVVVLAFGITSYTPSGGTQDFTDVPPNYFAYPYIETGFHAGILGGYDANSCAAHNAQFPCYLPNLPITRGQVTKLVVNAAHYPLITPTGGQPTFTDVPPSNVFFVSIETAHAHGVINGYNDNTFRPNNSVRRDEMAQIVYKGVTTP